MMQKKRHAIERTPCKIFRGGGRKRPIINSHLKLKKEDIKSMKNSLEQKRRKLKKTGRQACAFALSLAVMVPSMGLPSYAAVPYRSNGVSIGDKGMDTPAISRQMELRNQIFDMRQLLLIKWMQMERFV